MKSAVMLRAKEIIMEERPLPAFRDDEVLVKVKVAGICGGDMHYYNGTHPYSNYPRVYGHEFSGDIIQVGKNAANWKAGDRVVVEPTIACGKCYPCRIGKYNCCVDLNIIGVHSDGAYAEYVAVPSHKVFAIPDSLDYDLAALVEPYSIGAQVCKRANITEVDTVVIIGAGTIGLTVLDIAKSLGAKVLVADILPLRLSIAEELNADITVNSRNSDLQDEIMKVTRGEGASVVVEATGVPSIAEATPQMVANGGRVVIVGILNENISLSGILLTNKEMTVYGSRNSKGNFPYVIEGFASMNLHPKALITQRYKLDEISDAFSYINANPDKVEKVILEVESDS